MTAISHPDHSTTSPAITSAKSWRMLMVSSALFLGLLLAAGCKSSAAPEMVPYQIVTLPPPALNQVPLKEALQNRVSARVYAPKALDSQTVSNLLWSANGVNRPATGGRTAPSAYDWRHVELYLADAQGFARYDATRHALERLGKVDIRALTGVQDFVKTAPLTLVLVSDEGKMDPNEPQEMHTIFSGVGVGAVIQNIYLYCASAGLNVVVRASLERPALHKALGLKPSQKVIVAQTVGFPP